MQMSGMYWRRSAFGSGACVASRHANGCQGKRLVQDPKEALSVIRNNALIQHLPRSLAGLDNSTPVSRTAAA